MTRRDFIGFLLLGGLLSSLSPFRAFAKGPDAFRDRVIASQKEAMFWKRLD
ncbi:MAG: hypothetical protein HY805_06135 [Nitrospirae bacterium]|nr:hypothetical protein [Nitrospirota bacterium]